VKECTDSSNEYEPLRLMSSQLLGWARLALSLVSRASPLAAASRIKKNKPFGVTRLCY
jgi:hypothetical protein